MIVHSGRRGCRLHTIAGTWRPKPPQETTLLYGCSAATCATKQYTPPTPPQPTTLHSTAMCPTPPTRIHTAHPSNGPTPPTCILIVRVKPGSSLATFGSKQYTTSTHCTVMCLPHTTHLRTRRLSPAAASSFGACRPLPLPPPCAAGWRPCKHKATWVQASL